ncbi:hypothetical protein DRN74_06635, partial [Candidatus Micrarchaeota archaeon]
DLGNCLSPLASTPMPTDLLHITLLAEFAGIIDVPGVKTQTGPAALCPGPLGGQGWRETQV